MVILLEYVKKALLVCTFELLMIIDKHFHKNHPLNEIINRKNVNISYSCCPNNNIINSNNRRILNENTNNDEKENKICKCKQKQNITVLSMENK